MKPMLFNTEMTQALLSGKKTATRRVVEPQPLERAENPHKINSGNWYFDIPDRTFGGVEASVGPYRPPCHPGDILYVRETWALHPCNDRLPPSIPCKKTAAGRDCYIYKADATNGKTPCGVYPSPHLWRPSIHMPKEAARIFLRVKDVRVERLQEITDDGILTEGITSKKSEWLQIDFADLWNSTVSDADFLRYGWEANPWVWVIEFERVTKEEAEQA